MGNRNKHLQFGRPDEKPLLADCPLPPGEPGLPGDPDGYPLLPDAPLPNPLFDPNPP